MQPPLEKSLYLGRVQPFMKAGCMGIVCNSSERCITGVVHKSFEGRQCATISERGLNGICMQPSPEGELHRDLPNPLQGSCIRDAYNCSKSVIKKGLPWERENFNSAGPIRMH